LDENVKNNGGRRGSLHVVASRPKRNQDEWALKRGKVVLLVHSPSAFLLSLSIPPSPSHLSPLTILA